MLRRRSGPPRASVRLRPTRILVATGRAANAEGLGLEQLGVEITKRGIETDERLRAAENVWAIGDCTTASRSSRTSASTRRGSRRAERRRRTAKADYRAIPAVAFTDPQIATVGTTEGDGLVVGRWNVEDTSRASTYEKPKRHGFVKVVADPERGVLVGAVAVGPEAGEWCQQLTLAIRADVPVETCST